MRRFAQDVFIAAGLRTPFEKAGGPLAAYDALSLAVPVVRAMADQLKPGTRVDLCVWGAIIPNLGWSNLAREIWTDAGLEADVPAFSVILACATSITAALGAAGLLGGGMDLALVGGSEIMSRPPVGLKNDAARAFVERVSAAPGELRQAIASLSPEQFLLPTRGWSNRITGRTMGDHMEETAKAWNLQRDEQDAWALRSHQGAVRGWDEGFFDDLVLPLPEAKRDGIPRPDTSLEKLNRLGPAFDRISGRGTLTAGNSSPLTDGAAGCWVATRAGLERLNGSRPFARIVDFEFSAVDFRAEGLLMAPAYAIPRLLARNSLRFEDVALWEIHEAFAAQVLANVRAIERRDWVRDHAGIDADLGAFPWDRVNPNGGSVAIGHPFAATGARDLSQAVKELSGMPAGSRGIVSICADGGEGVVALLERV